MASTKSISRQPAKSEGTKVVTGACGRKEPGVPCAGTGEDAQAPGAGEGHGEGESGPPGVGIAVEQQSSSQMPLRLPAGVAGLCGSSESQLMSFARMAAVFNMSGSLRLRCSGGNDCGPLRIRDAMEDLPWKMGLLFLFD